jgi:hypothetical protein
VRKPLNRKERKARKDRRQHNLSHFIDQFAERAERAAEYQNIKTVYMTIKKLRGAHEQNQEIPVIIKNGIAIIDERAKVRRYVEISRLVFSDKIRPTCVC